MQPVISDLPPHKTQPNLHWPSVWQFGLSLFATMALWGIAALMLFGVFDSTLAGDTTGAIAILLNTAGMAFAGVLLLPSVGYALLRLLGKNISFNLNFRYSTWLIFVLPPVILLGYLSSRLDSTAYLFLPILHILAAVISVGWFVAIGIRGLSAGSPQLSWGIFGSGLVGAPLLSLVTELFALLLLVLFGMIFLLQDPQLMEVFLEFSQSLPENAPEEAINVLEPYLMQPGVLYIALLFGALLVPILEELFKPIGVWLLVGRQPTPSQGFAAGLLSGAGYALFENFLLGAGAGTDWAVVVIARLGTSLVHVLTTGLMGWALVLAWRERRYLRLGLTYTIAVAIHGIWNGMVILTAVSEIFDDQVVIPEIFFVLGEAAPIIFASLIVLCLLLLLGSNLALNRETTKDDAISAESDIIPPAQMQTVAETFPEDEYNAG